MRARQAARQDLVADRRYPFANLKARAIASLPATDERFTRLEYEGLYLLTAHPQHLRDLRVRLVAELKQDQRGALVWAQALDLLEKLTQLLSPFDLVRRPIGR